MQKQFKLTEKLNLVVEQLNTLKPETVNITMNHICVVDVSGSMYSQLPKIRTHLKNKMASLLNDGDTITMIWFSGRNQYGTVFEELEVNTVKDLSDIHKMIDKYLVDVGLTGFKQPLQLVNEVIQRIKTNRPDSAFNLFFMSDGYDNQWQKSEIISEVSKLETQLTNATFVEYGYYANHSLLNEMAEKCGGNLIFSEDFKNYELAFEEKLRSRSLGKKINFNTSKTPLYGFVTTVSNSSILTFSVNNNNVLLPESTQYICYLTEDSVDPDIYEPSYSSYILPLVYVLTNRMKSDIVYELLNLLGNESLFEQYSKAIGKQRILNFTNTLNESIDTTFDYVFNLKNKFNKKTTTLVEVLTELGSDGNQFYPYHELFNYKKIGRGKEAANEKVSEEDIKLLNEEIERLSKTNDFDLLTKKIEELKQKVENGKALEFVNTDEDKGFNLSTLVFNSERANISVLVRYNGYVVLPKNDFTNLPKDMFETFIYRNYSILADGNVNVKTLPVSLSKETFDFLQKNELLTGEVYEENKIYGLDLTTIPVISRDDVKSLNSTDMFTSFYRLLVQKGRQKVFKYFREENFKKVSTGFIEKYGEEANEFLKGLGLTEFNGFAPKMVSSEAIGDQVQVPLIELKAKGLSSLPSVNAVLTKIRDGKSLTASDKMLVGPINEYNEFINSDIYLNSNKKDQLFEIWLKDKEETAIKTTRSLIKEQAKQVFSVLVGQVWFDDAEDLSDYKKTLRIDNETVEFTAILSEQTIEL